MSWIGAIGSWLLGLLLLVLLVAVPIKIGAHLADARRKGVLWCALAAVVGVCAGHLTAALVGGYIGGGVAAFVGFIVAIRYLLGTSFAGALGLTLIAVLVQLIGFWMLVQFWAPGAAFPTHAFNV
jgi:hypothetical protein